MLNTVTAFILRMLPTLIKPTDNKDIFLYRIISTATSRIVERKIAILSFLTIPMIAITINVSQSIIPRIFPASLRSRSFSAYLAIWLFAFASSEAISRRSSGCSISVPRRSFTLTFKTSASRMIWSASGTDKEFSHFESVWRTTWIWTAKSSWLIFWALRYFFILTDSMTATSCYQHIRSSFYRQAMEINIPAE